MRPGESSFQSEEQTFISQDSLPGNSNRWARFCTPAPIWHMQYNLPIFCSWCSDFVPWATDHVASPDADISGETGDFYKVCSNTKWEFPPTDTIYKQTVMALNWNPWCSWCHSKNRWLLLSHYGVYRCERCSLFWAISRLFLSYPSTCESEVCLWLSFLLSVYLWRLKGWVSGRSCHICLIWPSRNEIPEGSQAANYPVLCTS